jgi:hypothetical protein
VNLRKPILVHLSKQVGAPTTHSAAQAEYDAGGAGLVLGWDNSPSIIIVCNGYANAYSLIVTSRSSEGAHFQNQNGPSFEMAANRREYF